MAEGFTDDGGELEAPPRRPLWVAGFAALLTAAFLAWIGLLSLLAYVHAREDKAHMFECDGCIRPPDPLTSEWWAYVAPIYPYIGLVAVAYAISLMAIIAYLERRPNRPRLPWPLAGALATAPLACIWVFLMATGQPADPAKAFFVPIVSLAIIGMIGGAVAGIVRRGSRG